MSTHSLNRPVLVVDDEADIRDLMEMTLMKMGLSVDTAEGVTVAKKKLDANRYSLVLTDMRMPDGSGLEVVEHIVRSKYDIPVAVITAYGNAEQAVQALKVGAFDYLQKPITLAQLRTLVKSAVRVQEETPAVAVADVVDEQDKAAVAAQRRKEAEAAESVSGSDWNHDDWLEVAETLNDKQYAFDDTEEEDIPAAPAPAVQAAQPPAAPANPKPAAKVYDGKVPRLLGSSPQMENVRRLICKLSQAEVPVYISGESGSGKEQAARSVHELSPRKDKAFIAVNCGAIPENLMESEFFGYKKGSFTGADRDRLGFFQHADGGTLFLDEVADLPLSMQVKLLRAIQEKAVRRIGDAQEQKVNVRIISATHKNLADLVEKGQFRQDLFYRLNVVNLAMPSLREMREDLPDFINRLLKKHNSSLQHMNGSAREALLRYNYPGNFRELENILERAVALSGSGMIDVEDLQIHAAAVIEEEEPLQPEAVQASVSVQGLTDFRLGKTQIQDYLDDTERRILEYALKITQGNRTQAAKVLGISFRSMRYRLERLGIEVE